jgi:membrane associated rhomboid family serine protease
MTEPSSGRPPAKWPGWKVGGATILSFVALLYIIEIADQLSGHALDRNGIRPLETDGLKGILFAPLLHADWAHLLANTVPALVLGFLVTLAGMAPAAIRPTALALNVIVAAIIGTPSRFLIASFGAILLSEGVDTEIYHRLRQRSWLMRVFSSNAVSVPLDSITFTVVAFAGEPGYDAAMMLQIIEADLLFKFGIGALIALGKSWWDRTLKREAAE